MKKRMVIVCLGVLALVVHRHAEAAEAPQMVMTVLEASVEASRIGELERAYRESTSEVSPDIVETFLARDRNAPALFRIITVWTSREALDKMRGTGVKPKGVQIFESVGATPKLRIFDIVANQKR